MSHTKDELQIMKKLGKNIANARISRGMTQEKLADLTEAGRRTIQSIENGERWPRPITLLRISRALKTPIVKFFSGIE
jgi:transcriptional regulator with XRE-family HTH domain